MTEQELEILNLLKEGPMSKALLAQKLRIDHITEGTQPQAGGLGICTPEWGHLGESLDHLRGLKTPSGNRYVDVAVRREDGEAHYFRIADEEKLVKQGVLGGKLPTTHSLLEGARERGIVDDTTSARRPKTRS